MSTKWTILYLLRSPFNTGSPRHRFPHIHNIWRRHQHKWRHQTSEPLTIKGMDMQWVARAKGRDGGSKCSYCETNFKHGNQHDWLSFCQQFATKCWNTRVHLTGNQAEGRHAHSQARAHTRCHLQPFISAETFLCSSHTDGQTDGRTDGRTDGQTNRHTYENVQVDGQSWNQH